MKRSRPKRSQKRDGTNARQAQRKADRDPMDGLPDSELLDLLEAARRAKAQPREADPAARSVVLKIHTDKQGRISGRKKPDPTREANVQFLHTVVTETETYYRILGPVLHDNDDTDLARGQTGVEFVEGYLREMAPRNEAERMLAIQMLWQHAKVNRLMRLPLQTDLAAMAAVERAIVEAVGLSRRLAETWAKIRDPRPTTFVRADQMNVAEQQVVAQSRDGSPKKPEPPTAPGRPGAGSDFPGDSSNEQGFTRENVTPPVPALEEGAGFPAPLGPPKRTVEEIYRAADAGRQAALGGKRGEARDAPPGRS